MRVRNLLETKTISLFSAVVAICQGRRKFFMGRTQLLLIRTFSGDAESFRRGCALPTPPRIDAEFLWRCSKFCVYEGGVCSPPLPLHLQILYIWGEQGSTLSPTPPCTFRYPYIMPGENSFRICNEPSVYTCDEKKEYIGKKHCSHLSNHGSNTDLTTVPD